MERELERTLTTLTKNYLIKMIIVIKKMEDYKVDKENKENIPNNEPPKALVNNEAIQTLLI